MTSRTGSTPTPPSIAEAGRSSPPPACAICLGQFQNKSFTETCLHQFCFNCLLEWSKIKAECPLCKQPFNTIIHSVRSNDVYDKYVVHQPEPPNDLEFTSEIMYSRRFRYRTTLTLHTRESIAIQRLFDSLPTDSSLNSNHNLTSTPQHFRNRITHSIIFRRRIYNQNMWAHPLPDITGRFRDCSPEIYRSSTSEVNRLIPWITRELSALLVDPTSISYALNEILTKITQHAIRSRAFHEFISTYVPQHTDQFIHEMYQFARSPFDMRGYDQYVSYGVGNPVIVDSFVNEISSSEENNSTDSDVLVVTPDVKSINQTINSDAALSEPSTSTWDNSRSLGCPIVIESIRQSDTDESSDEVVLVMCKKPPHERTPEIVDLVASDSDAIIIDETQPIPAISMNTLPVDQTPSPSSGPSTSRFRSNFKRKYNWSTSDSGSDSDNSSQPSVNKNSLIRNTLLRKYKSRKIASTCDTDRDTDSDSSSTSCSSNFSNSPMNLVKTPSTDIKNDELSQSKTNHDNKIIKTIFSKLAESQPSSSVVPEPVVLKRHKHKKSKHKKHSKKIYKHKTKSKKRSKSKDKPIDKQYKGKFCNKSKAKNKNNTDSLNEPFSPSKFKAFFDIDIDSSTDEKDSKRKTLKSVVTTVPSAEPEVKTNLLDLMNIAVLSSNSVLSIKNEDNDQETIELSKEPSCPIPDRHSTELQDSV